MSVHTQVYKIFYYTVILSHLYGFDDTCLSSSKTYKRQEELALIKRRRLPIAREMCKRLGVRARAEEGEDKNGSCDAMLGRASTSSARVIGRSLLLDHRLNAHSHSIPTKFRTRFAQETSKSGKEPMRSGRLIRELSIPRTRSYYSSAREISI